MKIINILLCSLLAISSLAACGKSDEKPPKAATNTATPQTSTPNTGVVVVNGTYTEGDLEYINAIKDGNTRRVKSILEASTANVNSGDQYGVSGLIIASSLKNSDVVAAILDKVTQGDIKVLDRTDTQGKTALIHAAESGVPETMSLLRKKGANPNIYNSNQDHALLILVRKNDVGLIRALIKNYSDAPTINLDLQNSAGESGVLAATKDNSRDVLKFLKEAGATLDNADINGITPLIYAASKSDKDMFDYLLSLGADINYLGFGKRTPLLYTIENKNYEFAKYILDKGANPNIHVKDLPSALQLAVSTENANLPMVEALLAKGAALTDPDMPLGNVIGRAIYKGNAPVIAKLIASGAKVSDLEDQNNNGLLQALNVEDPDIAMLMIDSGANMTRADVNGYTPLTLAAKKKYKNVFEAIVTRGQVDVNQTNANPKLSLLEIILENNDGDDLEIMFAHGLKANADSLLSRAVNEKQDNIIAVLLKHGANPNTANNIGEPALWTAIAKDDSNSAKLLAESGASINGADGNKGLTPLSLAINKGNREMAQYLIDKGANPNIADNNGFTSLAYAAAAGQADLVKSLIDHKADISAKDKNGNDIAALVDLSKLQPDKKEEIKKLLAAPPAAPATP